MEKEYERLREAHKQVYALQQEIQEVEEKWAAKLEDAVDETGLLKTRFFFFFFLYQYSHTAYTMARPLGLARGPWAPQGAPLPGRAGNYLTNY